MNGKWLTPSVLIAVLSLLTSLALTGLQAVRSYGRTEGIDATRLEQIESALTGLQTRTLEMGLAQAKFAGAMEGIAEQLRNLNNALLLVKRGP